ncbi:Hypothetical predicted protein [Olea europaea subsp. europaea]|uniref:Uncharacterized protein n=1 Tax=Olea europaea subsp. europaea TaxID=158383 RepID=A0A8S0PCI6_OLEEU|nr:Hypothetical predicted protein [Olea europaea subsp. europaea]
MRRSFGGGSRGMGGGIGGSGGGGGGILRTVQRAVRAGVAGSQSEPFSHATNTNTSTGANTPRNTRQSYKKKQSGFTLPSGNDSDVSSTFSSLVNLPVSATPNAETAAWGSCSSSTWNDESEWECVDSSEDEKGHVFIDDFVFGTVPSRDEVQHAVSALKQVFSPASFSNFGKEKLDQDIEKDENNSPIGYKQKLSSADSQLDWVEPSLHLFDSRRLQPHGADRVYDAFHLLQTETSVQKMVISLSSDKAVWDAVLNNEVVQEFRGSLFRAYKNPIETSLEGSDDSNPAKDVLNFIFMNTKAKIMQLIDKITELVNKFFGPRERENSNGLTDPLEEMLKNSFFLSIMVLLVVVMARTQSA